MSKLSQLSDNPDYFVENILPNCKKKRRKSLSSSKDERLFLKIMANAPGFNRKEKIIAKSLLHSCNNHHHESDFNRELIMKVTDQVKHLFSIIPASIPRDTALLDKTCSDLLAKHGPDRGVPAPGLLRGEPRAAVLPEVEAGAGPREAARRGRPRRGAGGGLRARGRH